MDNKYISTYKARLNADKELESLERENDWKFQVLMAFVLLGGLYVLDLLLNVLFN